MENIENKKEVNNAAFDISTFSNGNHFVIEASAGTGKTYNVVEMVKKLINNGKKLEEILIVTYTDKAAGELKNRIRAELKDVDVDNAPIYTIHSFCKNTIKEFGISASLPLNLNVIDDYLLEKFADSYLRKGKILDDIIALKCFDKCESIKETLIDGVKKFYLNKSYEEDASIISLFKDDSYDELYKILVAINNATCIDDVLNVSETLKDNYEVFSSSDTKKSIEFAAELEKTYNNLFDYNGHRYYISNNKGKLTWPTTVEEINALKYFAYLKKCFNKNNILKVFKTILTFRHLKDFYEAWQKEKEINKNQTFDDMIRYVRESIKSNGDLKKKLQKKYSIAIIDEFQDTNQKQFDIFGSIFLEDKEHQLIVVGDPKQSIYSFQGADIKVYYDAVNKTIEKDENKKDGIKKSLVKNYRSTANMVKTCNKLFEFYNFDGTTFVGSDYLSIKENKDKKEHHAMYDNKDLTAFWVALNKDNTGIKEKDTRTFAKIAVQQIIDCCSKGQDGKTKLQVKDKGDTDYRSVSFKDFTVLARTSTEMIYIENALKQAGIPFIRYKDNNLFSGLECAHWITLLQALNTDEYTGYKRKIFNKLMASKFFGYSLKEINSEHFTKDDIKEMKILKKWKKLAYKRKWEYLFDSVMDNSYLSKNMKTLKEIQSYSKFKQISNYCIDYLAIHNSIDDLIRNLENLANGGSADSEDGSGALVEKGTNFDCVQIMTIHASKGLQFPVVIAVCGFKKPSNKGKTFTYHDENGMQKLIFSKGDLLENKPIEITSLEELQSKDDNKTSFIKERIENEETAEWKRLFYVAYTRAQFLMIMPCYAEYGKDFLKNSMNEFISTYKDDIRFIYDNDKSFDTLGKESSQILNEINLRNKEEIANKNKDKGIEIKSDLTKEEQFEEIKKVKNKHNHILSFKHSYTSLSHGDEKEKDDSILYSAIENDKEGEEISGLSDFDTNCKVIKCNYDESLTNLQLPNDYPKGAKIGTALHEIFELMDFTNYDKTVKQSIESAFSNNGIAIKEDWINSTKEMVHNVLNATLPTSDSKIFKLKEISNENRKNEVEFNFNVLNKKLNNFCSGFVDLIFRYDGRYYILDWKSDKLNSTFVSYAKADSIKKHVDDSYSIQRVLYSYCLINYLKQFYKNEKEEEIFNKYFGGIYYIFLRGCNENSGNGVYLQSWESYEDLKKAFDEIIDKKITKKQEEKKHDK